MPTAILKAHYNGEHIVLDEPFELPRYFSSGDMVIAPNAERSAWSALGAQSLARAYDSDGEPEYTTADLQPR